MFDGKTVCVVVPAYNEEKLIQRVVETMHECVDRIVIVDDCSTDETVFIVKELRERDADRVVLIEHEQNQGVGGAIATGYKFARDHGFDLTAVMAGDAQMDPDDLPALLAPVASGEADYSKGNRLFTGEAWKKIPHIRYLGNSALSFMTKIASGYWHVADSQTGYTVCSLRVLKTLDLDSIYKRYGMPNDILVRLNLYDFVVVDVPINPVYDIGEKSGICYHKSLFTFSFLLARLFLWRMFQKYVIRDFHPLVFFYMMGFSFVPVGVVWGLYLFYLRITHGPVAPTSSLLAAFLIITGMQSLFFGMWMDMQHVRDTHNLRRMKDQ
ncbi:MAG: glycosyltransferase family 2 protein [Kiritimatiellae bacterium]|nr:glycosyltransferase family 2 protein [Kiritimatiellia bacterium]